LVLSIVLSNEAGGPGAVLANVPSGSFKFLPSFEFKEIVAYIAAWSVLGLGSIPSQDVYQRVMSSGSEKIAVRSCYIAGVLYLTIAMLPLFISLCTKHLHPELADGNEQMALPSVVLAYTSLPIQVMFFGSLLSAIMSTTSSAILAPASIFSENLVRPLAGHMLTDKQLLIITRISVLVFAAAGTLMATLRKNIYELVGESSILSLVSLLAPLLFGLYWKRTSSAGAILSMALGMLSWFVFEWVIELPIPSLVPATLISIFTLIVGSLAWPDKKIEQ
jgi:Na+/proline symporter